MTTQSTILDGIVNFNKAGRVTSRAAVNQVLHAAGIRKLKAGHAGTLDPIATGVLVVCLGKATRLVPYIHEFPKEYIGTFQLGVQSPSDDIESPLHPLSDPHRPSCDEILAILPRFLGAIEQVPPIYSAVKVDGRRAYKLARAGEATELKPKTVEIHRIDIQSYVYPHLELKILCGTGTYIRSLGRDIASALNSAAVMTRLSRTAVGPFQLATAVAEGDLAAGLVGNVLPCQLGVSQLSQLTVDEIECNAMRNGQPFQPNEAQERVLANPKRTLELAAVGTDGRLIAIIKQRNGQIWPVKFLDAQA
ncbi:MAG TPA: tRNA pseudouridine(55) synthase TruB [Planctomycetes bacterium]|nr:tRNA pseudouridine(55) synthase TruB [Planctomycetota bacterium]